MDDAILVDVTIFLITIALLVFQRFSELQIAKRNTKLLLEEGAVEFGARHYRAFILFHTVFFIGMLIEFFLRRPHVWPSAWPLFLFVVILAQVGRWWVVRSLDGRWTTRVIVLPGKSSVAIGPYRFIKHPNYVIVAFELLFVPLTFGLYYTAVLASIINAIVLLTWRLPIENMALRWAEEQAPIRQNIPV